MSSRTLTPLRIVPNIVAGTRPTDRVQVSIYRPFFLAGIVTVLTTGCLLGAVALTGISAQGSYTANVWTPYVLAHANSQLFGWVGLFIMGFALQLHPPRQDRAKLFHRLAYASLATMLLGILLRFVSEPLVGVQRDPWLAVGVASGVLQFASVGIFLFNSAYTRHRSGERLTWPTLLIFASLFWLFLIALAEPFAFFFAHQVVPQNSILFVAKYFPVLRETQFLGFVAMMIFGVGYLKWPSCFGFQKPHSGLGLAGFTLWTAGLIARTAGWVIYFNGEMDPQASKWFFTGGLMLATGAVLLVNASRVFEAADKKMPSHKFIRTSLAWLLVSGGLLIAEKFHLGQTGASFSHAYTGAIRHAVTVGFISQMILGVGMHVIANHGDLPLERQPELWSAFLLLNIGNTIRVALEIATDYTPSAFKPMGMSGFVELLGLIVWAAFAIRTLRANRKPAPQSAVVGL